ncbi:MAG: MgtC/SapB family protein [Enhydrobacter sp.]|nr:MAG: MgtC/SapB family protein [Enhydrobacter sp.]
MTDVLDEIGRPTWLPFSVIAARLLLAALLGAVIGFEREWRHRPAGLRTHILVCLAAATFAVLTVEIVHAPVFAGEALRVDPIRVVEAVTAGVAFLAAGTIILARGEVQGLTTGAGMWLAGAIGLAAGLGLWQIAVLGTALVVIVAGLIYSVEAKLKPPASGAEPGSRPPTED